jgi:polysaccharide export outer membrane protein
MNMQKQIKGWSPIALSVLLLMLASCVPYKNVRYFNDLDKLKDSYVNPREQKRISPFDNLYIKVLSTDEKTAQIFNATEQMQYNAPVNTISFLVDEKGNVNFPFAGNINVGGLTLAESSIKIQKALSDYMPNTAVIVKFIDNKLTVMGEVQRQGVFNFTDDKINIYEALSLAGGLTRFGSHKDIVLIRQENNKLVNYRLDLSDSKIVGTNLYYVLPNDVIVVEPLRQVSWSYQNMTYSTVLTTLTTVVAVLLYFGNIKF